MLHLYKTAYRFRVGEERKAGCETGLFPTPSAPKIQKNIIKWVRIQQTEIMKVLKHKPNIKTNDL